MMKSLMLNFNFTPMIFNIFIIMIISFPSNNYKFNPITMTLLLIFLTMMISMKMNLMINSWSSFILFLIMIGGLMIIFLYITSLANNELFTFNLKSIILNIIKMTPLLLLYIMLMNELPIHNMNNSYTWFNNLNMNYYLNFYEMYTLNFYKNSLFIMNYLFYSMICIMNICYKMKSPLRQLFF